MKSRRRTKATALEGIALPPKHLQATIPFLWLRSLKRWGYTSVALQNDPTLPRPGAEDHPRDGSFRLHYLYDLGAGEPRRESLQYFRRMTARIHRAGLKAYLDCWEPCIPRLVWEKLPRAWKGWRDGHLLPGSLDWTEAEAVAWYWALVRRALERLPFVDGVILGREDNEAHLGGPSDPAVPLPAMSVRWAEFYARFYQEVKAIRPQADFILYDWWWHKGDHETILRAIPEKVRVVTRLENNTKPYHHPAFLASESMINDVSLSVFEPGEDARAIFSVYTRRGHPAYAMVPFMGPIECFMQPYAVAPGLYFNKLLALQKLGLAGWMDYDCGGIEAGLTADVLEIFRAHSRETARRLTVRLVRRRYGDGVEEPAVQALDHFERAVRMVPVDAFSRDNRMLNAFGVSLSLAPVLPVRPLDAWQGRADWERPEDRHTFDPHNYAEPRSLQRVIPPLVLALDAQMQGLVLFRAVQDLPGTAEQKRARARDGAIAAAFASVLRSGVHFFQTAALLQKIRRELRLTPADQLLLETLRDNEIANCAGLRDAIRQRPDLYANSTHDIWRYANACDSRLPNAPAALDRKIRILSVLGWRYALNKLCPTLKY